MIVLELLLCRNASLTHGSAAAPSKDMQVKLLHCATYMRMGALTIASQRHGRHCQGLEDKEDIPGRTLKSFLACCETF